MNHDVAIEVLKIELEAVQSNCVYLSAGLQNMLSRNLTPGHPKIREAALIRWKGKLEDQAKRSEALLKTIQYLESLED